MEHSNLEAKFINLRDEIIERYFCGLNDEQLKAVLSRDRKVLVAACPGAGKTQVIINRIIYLATFGETYKSGKHPQGLCSNVIDELRALLQQENPLRKCRLPASLTFEAADLDNIVVITFTRMAAKGMRERYENISGLKETPFFGTFHSFFLKILRQNLSSIKIISERDKYGIIEEAAGDFTDAANENRIRGILNDISSYKTALKLKAELSVKTQKEVFHSCFEKYEGYKKRNLLLDFDDLMIEALNILETKPKILEELRSKVKYMLVDEFQDCDSLQIHIIKTITEKNSVFAVGDEDQCIYGFRGSRPDCMVDFPNHFQGGVKLFLNRNYRSMSNIITISKSLISNNNSRNKKDMIPVKHSEGIIETILCESEEHQAEKAAELVLQLKDKYPLEEMAILYRTNRESALLAGSLSKFRIGYRIMEREPNIFHSPFSGDILAYLKLSLNIFDKESFVRIINKPYRYIGSTKIEKLKSFSCCRNPFSYICELPDTTIKQAAVIRQMEKSILKLKKMTPEKALDYLLNKLNYMAYIEKQGISSHILEELRSTMYGFSSIADFLKFSAEYADVSGKSMERGQEVTLSTIHGVKGLEFRNVIIVNCAEDSMPHINSKGNMEEERRLFYVAITRAAENLWLLCPCSCKGIQVEPSPYIHECGLEFNNFCQKS